MLSRPLGAGRVTGIIAGACLLWTRQAGMQAQESRASDKSIRFQASPVVSPAIARFCKQLNTADTLAFTARRFRWVNMGRDFLPQNICAVQIKRPNLFVVHNRPVPAAKPGSKSKQEEVYFGELFVDMVSDGKTQIEMDPRTHQYKTTSAPESLLLTDSILLNDINISTVLSGNRLNRYKAIPEETLEKKRMIVFESTVVMAGDRIQAKLYFDKATGELTRMSYLESEPPDDKMKEHVRVEYSGWKFNAALPPAMFDTTPPPDGKRLPDTP